jgi:hypothetical protein
MLLKYLDAGMYRLQKNYVLMLVACSLISVTTYIIFKNIILEIDPLKSCVNSALYVKCK